MVFECFKKDCERSDYLLNTQCEAEHGTLKFKNGQYRKNINFAEHLSTGLVCRVISGASDRFA